jgi:uncharacterized protein (DUF3084 family)
MISQLSTVEQFSALIDLMKNPEKFEGMVNEAKKAVKEMKDLLGAKATVEAAEAYSKKVDKDVTAQYSKLEEDQKTLEQNQADFYRSSQDKEIALAKRSTQLDEREAQLKQKEFDLIKKEESINDRASDVSIRESNCVTRDMELRTWAAALEDKAARIQAILK